MVEDFLHFVWEHKLFNLNELKTVEGEHVTIYFSGSHNHSSGPDFSEAQITIGDTKWVGSVEIHLKSSDWLKHGHSGDSAYNNVVLHVVFEDDHEILNDEQQKIPTVELKGRISAHVIKNYETLKRSRSKIPCENSIADFSAITRSAWLSRMIVERLERKTNDVELIFNQSGQNWQQTYYSLVAACLGQNNNKLPMLELTRKLPHNIISKQADDTERTEALMLGVAGFLKGDFNVDYVSKLQSEYSFQKKKNSLTEVSQVWKTGRIRPENAPIRRVAQLSAMTEYIAIAMSDLLSKGSFQWDDVNLNLSDFWRGYYSFSVKSSRMLNTNISKSLSDLIAINGHAPFLFFYGQKTGEQELKDKALNMLESFKPETNKILRLWKDIGVDAHNALDSQALIELERQYFTHKKCVICTLGKSIISSL